ncbi:putative bifunctional diguanylate cyclase/phosphodiesterase [Mariprofundus ferrinatatus]|nr:bifunctional diguanylate cyclase/phosphodiesterase [Mariprofundus ferrinatatus]
MALILLLALSIAEFFIMLYLDAYQESLSFIEAAVLDAIVLSLLLTPVVYMSEIRPVLSMANALREDERNMLISHHVFECSSEMLIVFDDGWCSSFYNSASKNKFACDGMITFETIVSDEQQAEKIKVWLYTNDHWTGQLDLLDCTGLVLHSHSSITKIANLDSDGVKYALIAADITDAIQTQNNLDFLTKFDPVTTLQNSFSFEQRVLKQLSSVKNGRFCVAVIRIENLKSIFSMHGDPATNKLICSISHELEDLVDSDQLARLSKDEFGLIMLNYFDEDALHFTLNKVVEIVETERLVGGVRVLPRCDIGCCCATEVKDGESIISCAFVALDHGKRAGARIEFYDSQIKHAEIQKAVFRNELRDAVRQMDFDIVFQPQVDINNNTLTGVEALLRWNNNGENVSPAIFVSELEQSGAIYDVGMWVLRQCCKKGKRWFDEGTVPFSIAVNVSALQLMNENFRRDVMEVLATTHFPPSLLELEFTESSMVADPVAAEQVMSDLGSLGVKIAIDDFGTGYSSLSYLKKFKTLDKLKIDKSFVDSLNDGEGESVITDAIIGLAKSLHLKAIAEGVEGDHQVAYLKSHGCDQLQGYLISKPIKEDELLEFAKGYANKLHSVAANV